MMFRKWCLFLIALLSLAISVAQANDRVPLGRIEIVVDPSEPSFVQYGVEELAAYLKELTGVQSPVRGAVSDHILVGSKAVGIAFPQALSEAKIEGEGYLLKLAAKDNANYVIASGVSPHGTKAAISALLKTIRCEGKKISLPSQLNTVGKPAYAKRGIHLNGWPLAYPYTFRSWTEQDWHRYLDILACQNVNVFYLWPFIEIMPVPFSPEDQAYLEECRRVVDYAQKKHGMEVWIMQCTNRVAKDRCGVADPRLRPYWRPVQEDLNPGVAADYQAIMTSRAAMYRIINNADGVCNIDSDPGFCPGSPVSDYVKVLQGCRTLLDRYNLHGKDTKLIHWMLWGWGRKGIQADGLADHQRATLPAVKQGLPEPLWLISGQFPEFLPICRDNGLIAKTLYMPYGVIEGEPAYPGTNVQIDMIRGTFQGPDAKFPGLAGVMGNIQTPLLQFPNMFYFTSAMYDSTYLGRSEKEVLLEVAEHLYPEHKQLVADSYLALKDTDPAKIANLANQLDQLVRTSAFGRLGVFGRKLFPKSNVAAESLVLQLRLRAANLKLLAGLTPTASKAECERLLCQCLDAYVAWDKANGWHKLWGWNQWQLAGVPSGAIAQQLRKNLGGDSEVNAFFAEISPKLAAKHGEEIAQQGCVLPLKSAVLAIPAAAKAKQ